MKKDVIISIKALHDDGDDSTPIESTMPGRYYKKDGAHYLLYEEVLSTDTSGTDTCKNRCRILPDRVEIIKDAPVSAKMVFAVNETNTTNYNTPYGTLIMSMTTKSIAVHESEDMLDVRLVYDLDAGGAPLSKCVLTITVLNMSEC